MKLPTSNRKIVIILWFIVLVLGGYGIWRVIQNRTSEPEYRTSSVKRKDLQQTITGVGKVQSSSTQEVNTALTGTISEVYVNEGDIVTEGQKIAKIVPDDESSKKQSDAYAALLSARSAVASAKATLYSLQSDSFSANQKFINDAVARNLPTTDPTYIQEHADWLAAEAHYNNQQTNISSAQSKLTSAQIAYTQLSSTLTSPKSGTIDEIKFKVGDAINPKVDTTKTATTTVATLTTTEKTTVASNIPEVDIPKVEVGQKAYITFDAFEGKNFAGMIIDKDKNGNTDSAITTYTITLELDQENTQILSQMTANITIITAAKEKVLVIPSQAIVRETDGTYARVLEKGRATLKKVEVGLVANGEIEIVSGLDEGETVITGTVSSNTESDTSQQNQGQGRGRGAGRALIGL